jgi:predicted ATPase
VEYIFKHALTQEVAYNSLLQERRKGLHERTAQAIGEVYRSRLEDHYSDLAHHYSRSGNTQKAVEYLQLAGQQAVQRSANAEAITHFTAALELLKTLPGTPERDRQELTLRVTLGPALMATKGWAAPEIEKVYTRARELCQHLGETSQLFSVLFGLQAFYVHRAKLQTARELAEQGLTLAQKVQDPALLLEAHHMLVYNLLYLGELTLAREYAEGIALYDRPPHSPVSFLAGDDPVVCCLSHRALALWALGYPDQALKSAHDALTQAQRLSHPLSLALALIFAAVLHQFRRERQTDQEKADAVMTLSTEQGFQYWLAWGILLRGWALTEEGQEEGIAQIRQGLAAYQATGSESWRPYHLALLAEAYGKVGKIEEGLSTLTEALAGVDKTGECLWEAELYRLKGQLTLQAKVNTSLGQVEASQNKSENGTPESEAEEYFLKAIEIARRQQAKSLELRAVMSLSRLWQQQGKKDEARRMLAEIYGWFTEGFDTVDLKEAKALLEELT